MQLYAILCTRVYCMRMYIVMICIPYDGSVNVSGSVCSARILIQLFGSSGAHGSDRGAVYHGSLMANLIDAAGFIHDPEVL